MAALPAKPMLTVDAIYAKHKADQDSGFREHLGASIIGTECERSLWYSFRWATRIKHEGRQLRLFERGQLEENRFVSALRSVGVEVHETDPETGKQIRCRDETGHFGGSCDGMALGLLEAPATWHVCEFKTHSERSFEKLKREGVRKSKPLHFAQMQTYMHLFGIERAFYLSVNKNNDELYSERLHYDVEYAVRLIAKARRAIFADEAPSKISDDPSWFMCRFCDHNSICHAPSVEKLPEPHCRTCLHSSPVDGGGWHCAKISASLDAETQRQGCPQHLYLPSFIPGEVVEVIGNDFGVAYRLNDGSSWTDGVPF